MNEQPTAVSQAEMFVEHPDAIALRNLLSEGHWLKRDLICRALNWPTRRVPAAAELLGAEIVRSRTHGFKLVAKLTPEDFPVATHAANEFISQAKKNEAYGLALKIRMHQLIS